MKAKAAAAGRTFPISRNSQPYVTLTVRFVLERSARP